MHVAVVKATFDEDAGVWYIESSDVEGLHVEGTRSRRSAATLRTPPLISSKGTGAAEVHIEIIAHASVRARVAA